MKLFVYENYKEYYPELKNRALTDALIIKAACDYGLDETKVSVYRNENNKPYVRIGSEDGIIYVSVSHSESVFACLVAEHECGLDIQAARQVNLKGITSRYFDEAEREAVKCGGEDEFFRLWTRKEAYAKYTGAGIKQVMSGVQVIDREDVAFEDSILDGGMYCSICYGKRDER